MKLRWDGGERPKRGGGFVDSISVGTTPTTAVGASPRRSRGPGLLEGAAVEAVTIDRREPGRASRIGRFRLVKDG